MINSAGFFRHDKNRDECKHAEKNIEDDMRIITQFSKYATARAGYIIMVKRYQQNEIN